jgi:hypothetical protein
VILVLGAEGQGGGGDVRGQGTAVRFAAAKYAELGCGVRPGAGLAVAVDVGRQGLQRGDGEFLAVSSVVLDPAQVAPRIENDAAQLVSEGLAVELAWEAVG